MSAIRLPSSSGHSCQQCQCGQETASEYLNVTFNCAYILNLAVLNTPGLARINFSVLIEITLLIVIHY